MKRKDQGYGQSLGGSHLPGADLAGVAVALVMLTTECNLRCCYCPLQTSAAFRRRSVMAEETLARVLDLVFSAAGEQVEIGIFGGEPLLRPDLARRLVEGARQRAAATGTAVRFLLFTNGTMLTPELYRSFTGQGAVVQVDIDGAREVHDRQRPTAGGSFDRIMSNIMTLRDSSGGLGNLVVNSTLTKDNLALVEQVERLEELGVGAVRFFPVESSDPRLYLEKREYRVVLDELRRLVPRFKRNRLAGRGIRLLNFELPLTLLAGGDGPLLYKCGAGAASVLIHTDGSIYPCMQLADNAYRLGDVEHGLDGKRRAAFLQGLSIRDHATCRVCSANRLCLLSCFYRNLTIRGGLDRIDPDECDFIRAHMAMIGELLEELEALRGETDRVG